jgi:L-lactate dehydrogenase (cytochrome)
MTSTPRRLPRWSELSPLLSVQPPAFGAQRVDTAADLGDLRYLARRRTPRPVFDYVDGAAGDEVTLRRNRQAFSRVEFRPSVLRDVSRVDPSTTLLGGPSALPLAFAPTGFTRMMHHEGERAVARVAERRGLPTTLSTMGTVSLEELAQAAPGARRWFQLYLWQDRDASKDFVARASAAGYEALVLTVDTPVGGQRLRDVRNGLTIPPALTLRTLADFAMHPGWWANLLTTEPLRFASLSSWGGTVAELADKVFDPAATLEDVRWLRDVWGGKLVVKGIQGADDARVVVPLPRGGGLQPRRPPAGAGPGAAGGAARGGRRGRRPGRGADGRRRALRRGRGRRGGAGGARGAGRPGLPLRPDGRRRARRRPGDADPRRRRPADDAAARRHLGRRARTRPGQVALTAAPGRS